MRFACFLIGLLVLGGSRPGTVPAQLPKILILGDQVYQQPAAELSKALRDRAEVVYWPLRPGEIRNSQTVLEQLDELLDAQEWDLIHFNVGLGDLVHRAPGMQSFRVLPFHAGGVRATSVERYRSNLEKLVERLKATGTPLIWASTTPIRHSGTGVFQVGSEIEYNAVAADVMTTYEVPINDMEAHVRQLIDMEKPAGHNADPFHFDRQPIHGPILACIEQFLQTGQALPPAPTADRSPIDSPK